MTGPIALRYTGDPCTDCAMERRYYGSCSKALSDACAAKQASVPPPAQTTGGVGSAPAPTVIPSGAPCGSCKKTVQVSGGSAPTAGTPGVVTAPGARRSAYPWWVIVLAALALAQIISGGRDNGIG